MVDHGSVLREHAAERVRQETKAFDQNQLRQEKWFRLRFTAGWVALVLLPAVFVACIYVIDAVSISMGIWKTILAPNFVAPVPSTTSADSEGPRQAPEASIVTGLTASIDSMINERSIGS